MRSAPIWLSLVLALPVPVSDRVRTNSDRHSQRLGNGPDGALVSGADVTLDNSLTGSHNAATTEPTGGIHFQQCTLWLLHFARKGRGLPNLRSKRQVFAQTFRLLLNVKTEHCRVSESISVQTADALVQSDASGTQTTVDESFIRRTPGASGNRQLQKVIATTAGWRAENDGLLHVRGVDDGILYVIDGVPVTDRLDVVSGNAFDTETIRSLNVITGSIPAEFGGRSGAVVTIQSKSTMGDAVYRRLRCWRWQASARLSSTRPLGEGSDSKEKLGFLVNAFGNRSRRFLDPVDPGNFNNRGGALGFHRQNRLAPNRRRPHPVYLSQLTEATFTSRTIPNRSKPANGSVRS